MVDSLIQHSPLSSPLLPHHKIYTLPTLSSIEEEKAVSHCPCPTSHIIIPVPPSLIVLHSKKIIMIGLTQAQLKDA
jgi:hypothetical protein